MTQPQPLSTQPLAPLKYVKPDQPTIQKAFEDFLLVKSFVNWKPRSNGKGKWLKVPNQKVNEPSSHLLLAKATKNINKPLGLVCNASHSLVAMDIDGVNPSHTTSKDFKEFCNTYPTYEEASPSGLPHRRRRIYALENKEQKELFSGQPKHPYPEQEAELALYVNSGFVTLTGQETNNLPITTINADTLLETWPAFRKKPKDKKIHPLNAVKSGLQQDRLASLTKIHTWIQEVPCDRDHPRVIDLCIQEGWNYYDYWLTGIMALHWTFGPTAGIHHAHEWSQKDPVSYDPQILEDKWAGFSDKTSLVTDKTYQWLFNRFNIDWPVKNKNGGPVHTEVSNFDSLLGHYGISLQIDGLTLELFVDGPDSTLYPRFYPDKTESFDPARASFDRICSIFKHITREHKFRPSVGEIKSFMKSAMLETDPDDVKIRFADEVSAYSYSPEQDGDLIRMVARDILQRDKRFPQPSQEFHETLVHKWFLSMGRSLWPKEIPSQYLNQTAEGILIISGEKGGIGKSTFGKKIFPPEWEHLQCSVKPRLSGQNQDKDYKMKTCSRLLVDFDEAERILSVNGEADLKAEITASRDLFRVPYGTEVNSYQRRYSLVASTNESMLTIPRQGARRYWWINVNNVDLDALDGFPLYKLWAQVKYELINADTSRSDAPWLLTPEERNYLTGYLSPHRSENRFEIALSETFDFSLDGYREKDKIAKQGDFDTTTNINHTKGWHLTMGLKDIAAALNVDPGSALKRALTFKLRTYAPSSYFIGQGEVIYGIYIYKGQTRYYLPVPRS